MNDFNDNIINKMIYVDKHVILKNLYTCGKEERKGYLNALMVIGIVRRCELCGRLFWVDKTHRRYCYRIMGDMPCTDRAKLIRMKAGSHSRGRSVSRYNYIKERLLYRISNGDEEATRIYKNFVNAYNLCDTEKERLDVIELWESEYPSLRKRTLKGRPSFGE